jgi:superfamily I DNA/RNA helicase
MIVDKYAESSGTPLDEKRRLYYVCATRAKKKLFIIHFGKARLGSVLGPVLSPSYVEE